MSPTSVNFVFCSGWNQCRPGLKIWCSGSSLQATVLGRSQPLIFVGLRTQLLSFFLMFTLERKRESMSGRGTERERETQNLKQPPGPGLAAQSTTGGSNPWPMMRSWPELKSDTQPTEPPRCPLRTQLLRGLLSFLNTWPSPWYWQPGSTISLLRELWEKCKMNKQIVGKVKWSLKYFINPNK